MKRVGALVVVLGLAISGVPGLAQEQQTQEPRPKTQLLAINIFGPFVGLYEGYYETRISGNLTFYVAPQYLNLKLTLLGSLIPEGSQFWGLGATAGLNLYFAGPVTGLYVGGGGKFLLLNISDSSASLSVVALGVQTQLGYRWVFGSFAIAPQLNVGYTIAVGAVGGVGAQAAGFKWGLGIGLALAF